MNDVRLSIFKWSELNRKNNIFTWIIIEIGTIKLDRKSVVELNVLLTSVDHEAEVEVNLSAGLARTDKSVAFGRINVKDRSIFRTAARRLFTGTK
jgi:hypothetical protein